MPFNTSDFRFDTRQLAGRDLIKGHPSIVIAESLSIFDKKRITFNFKNLFKKYIRVIIVWAYKLADHFGQFSGGQIPMSAKDNVFHGSRSDRR